MKTTHFAVIGHEGIDPGQEPKYTTNAEGKIINRATGVEIPDDEPVFILRAKDYLAVGALDAYALMITNPEHEAAVRRRIAQFVAFEQANPDRMKVPDTAP